MQVLLDAKATPDVRNKLGRTPLHHAAAFGYCASAQVLVDARAVVDFGDSEGMTALHLAVLRGHTALVPILADSQANLWCEGLM